MKLSFRFRSTHPGRRLGPPSSTDSKLAAPHAGPRPWNSSPHAWLRLRRASGTRRGRGQSDCPRLACSPREAAHYLSSICCRAWSGIFRGAGALASSVDPPGSGPGPGTIALRNRGVGLSSVTATNPPPSLSGRLREPGGCSALPEGVGGSGGERGGGGAWGGEATIAARVPARPPGVPVHGPRAPSCCRRRSDLCEVRVTASLRAGVTTQGGSEQPGRCSPRTVLR